MKNQKTLNLLTLVTALMLSASSFAAGVGGNPAPTAAKPACGGEGQDNQCPNTPASNLAGGLDTNADVAARGEQPNRTLVKGGCIICTPDGAATDNLVHPASATSGSGTRSGSGDANVAH